MSLNDLKTRGVGNPKLFITDGLNSLDMEIHKVFLILNVKDVLYIYSVISWLVLDTMIEKKYVVILREFKIKSITNQLRLFLIALLIKCYRVIQEFLE